MAARYTVREEAANVATHVAGLLASVVGVGVLIYLGVVIPFRSVDGIMGSCQRYSTHR